MEEPLDMLVIRQQQPLEITVRGGNRLIDRVEVYVSLSEYWYRRLLPDKSLNSKIELRSN